ncbi:MAG: alpha/beta fold hydrolase, partial [Treponema sp.]|nr:alpha/beta fold hydrolase [Treponema sp.]
DSFKTIHIYSGQGDKTPIFFAHGGNIGPEAYIPLAQKLPEDQPFYCFENYNIYHSDRRIRGVASLAEKYIEFLRELVPRGPYILGGWSFGGLLAFEMARQLEAAGEGVEHLYLLDPRLLRTGEERELREKLLETNNYREYLSRDPLFERFRNLGLLDKLIENNREVGRDIQAYIPASGYGGETTLFKAAKADPADPGASPETLQILRRFQAIADESPDNGFGGYVPRLRIIEIPEIHDGFMRGEALEIIASVIGNGCPACRVFYRSGQGW